MDDEEMDCPDWEWRRIENGKELRIDCQIDPEEVDLDDAR